MNGAATAERGRAGAFRRILVALDASADSAAAVEAAVELAAALGAEIEGLYVEDLDLVSLGALSPLSEIDFLSGELRSLAPAELERHLRRRGERARRVLEGTAGRARVRWSFRTARGRVASELLAAGADLITVGVRGHSPKRGPGSTVTALLARSRAPVLVIRRGTHLRPPIYAVYDGSPAARAALSAAAEVARLSRATVTVLVSGAEAQRRDEIKGLLGGSGEAAMPDGFQVGRLPEDPAELVESVRRRGCGLLVVPRSGTALAPEALRELVRRARCPVLVVG